MGLFDGFLGLGGGLLGGLIGGESERHQASQNAVAPGIGAGEAQQYSQQANRLSSDALARYAASLGGINGQAQQYGTDTRNIFAHYAKALNSGQAGMMGMANRGTGQVADVYKNYGREAEGVARQNYGNLMNNITDQRSIARARGGNNTGQDMLASGARAQATQGLNSNLADIAGQRAQMYGGALQQGLATKLGVAQGGQQMQQNLLGQQQAMRQAAFQIPAQYAQSSADRLFQGANSSQQLYPDINAWMALNYGRGPQGSNIGQQLGGDLQGLGMVGAGYNFFPGMFNK